MITVAGGEVKYGAALVTTLFQAIAHKQIMRETNKSAVDYIKTVYEVFHFELSAFSRYSAVYVKRSVKWQKLKARVVHHQRPNVFSGELRRAVLTESVTRSTPDHGSFEAKAPMTSMQLTGRNKGKRTRRPLTKERRAELEFVNQDEIDSLVTRQRNEYLAAMYDPRWSKKILKKFR